MSGPRIDVVTIFPELVEPFLDGALVGSARREARLDVAVTDLRQFAHDRHRSVDDAPYGGGDGMVFLCEPVVDAIESLRRPGGRVFLTSPRGRVLDQPLVQELAELPQLILVCGRYAGFDERIAEITGAEELSIGDYVLSGGELAALVVTEAVARLVPGVVGNPDSVACDSFADGLLEYPIYTRPACFRGHSVPDVLLSGDHAAVARWRRHRALERTLRSRPDLLDTAELSGDDREFLREMQHD